MIEIIGIIFCCVVIIMFILILFTLAMKIDELMNLSIEYYKRELGKE